MLPLTVQCIAVRLNDKLEFRCCCHLENVNHNEKFTDNKKPQCSHSDIGQWTGRAGYSVDSSKHPGHALQDDGQLKCDNTVVTL